ncbi:hypothetical protein GCM10009861_02890 [Neomicrococcus aestuarii]
MPTKKIPTASKGKCSDHSATPIPIAAHAAAPIMVVRSPKREVRRDAGTFMHSDPRPMMVIIAAASPVEAPKESAVKDTMGETAPNPTEYSRDGA